MLKSSLLGRDRVLINSIDQTTKITKALSRALRYGIDFNYRLSESPSEEIVIAIADFNSGVKELMRQLPRPPVTYMAKTVLEWFENSLESEQEEFITTEFANLLVFMPSIGMHIINHFNLWAYPWNAQIEDGRDMSPNHPENLALQVIEHVWRLTKNDS